MILCWRINTVNEVSRDIGYRTVYVDTSELGSLIRVAVETTYWTECKTGFQKILKYRRYFSEEVPAEEKWDNGNGGSSFAIPDYFEDEHGRQLSGGEVGEILTGDSNCVVIPARTPSHVVRYMMSERSPIALKEIHFSDIDRRRIGYFVRDVRELFDASFFRHGPGTYSTSESLQTTATDEEIRSFVMIFRRLYMPREEANFIRTADIISSELVKHPTGTLISDWVTEYKSALESIPRSNPMLFQSDLTFNGKRLLDVFIYTQYAHQPRENRERQFRECLEQVKGNRGVLYWLFLTEMWKCSLIIANAGKLIEDIYEEYCQVCGVSEVSVR